jgi:hypothetical protein
LWTGGPRGPPVNNYVCMSEDGKHSEQHARSNQEMAL